MKNKTKIRDFDAVKYMRRMRDKISSDVANLSKKQILDYFDKNTPKERIMPSA